MTVEQFDAAVNAAADKLIAAGGVFKTEIDALVVSAEADGLADHILAACLTAVQVKIERAMS